MKCAGILYEYTTALGKPVRRDGAAVLAIAKKWDGENL